MFDPGMVEAVHASIAGNLWAADRERRTAQAALTALCAHLNLPPSALNALAAGEAVVVPRALTEDMEMAVPLIDEASGEPVDWTSANMWRAMLAASPYAPGVKGGGDE